MLVTRDSLDRLVEFDSPFTIVNGRIRYPFVLHTPSVRHDETSDIEIDNAGEWSALSGFTGQYSYSGAVMHPSEFLGGRLAETVIEIAAEEPETVFIVVECHDENWDYPDDPIGWVVLYRAVG